MWDIAQALGIPTLFIRYNPDSYMTSDGIPNDSNNKEKTQIIVMYTGRDSFTACRRIAVSSGHLLIL